MAISGTHTTPTHLVESYSYSVDLLLYVVRTLVPARSNRGGNRSNGSNPLCAPVACAVAAKDGGADGVASAAATDNGGTGAKNLRPSFRDRLPHTLNDKSQRLSTMSRSLGRMRGAVVEQTGMVLHYDADAALGAIKLDDGDEPVPVHGHDIENTTSDTPVLQAGQRVRFETARTAGFSRAVKVRPIYMLNFTQDDWERRSDMLGSQRAMYDRTKFEEEFDDSVLDLDVGQRAMYQRNPHLRQVFVNHRPFVRSGRMLQGHDRVLNDFSGRTKYSRRQGEVKTVEHWGQRKLMLSEIEFLVHYGRPGTVVVYAGAAPGTHTNFLAEVLFPEMTFHLVDPAPFAARPVPNRVELRNTMFTDETAEEFAALRRSSKRLLFISDIRSMDETMSHDEKEARVVHDMAQQANWVRTMQPAASMLKFRLPYTPGSTTYLAGDIWFPVWGGRTTSESRLIVTDPTAPPRVYSHEDYEDGMFHFNTKTRTTYFEHRQRGDGFDHCYDCAAEVFILAQYLSEIRGQEPTPRAIDELSELITRNASTSGRRLTLRLRRHGARARPKAVVKKQTDRSALPEPLRPRVVYSDWGCDMTEENGCPMVVFADDSSEVGPVDALPAARKRPGSLGVAAGDSAGCHDETREPARKRQRTPAAAAAGA